MTASSVSSIPSSAAAWSAAKPASPVTYASSPSCPSGVIARIVATSPDDGLGGVVLGPGRDELRRLILGRRLDRARRRRRERRQLAARQLRRRDHADDVADLQRVADGAGVGRDPLQVGRRERRVARVEDHRGRLVAAREARVDDLVDARRLGVAGLERVALVGGERLQLGLEGQRHERSEQPGRDDDPFDVATDHGARKPTCRRHRRVRRSTSASLKRARHPPSEARGARGARASRAAAGPACGA